MSDRRSIEPRRSVRPVEPSAGSLRRVLHGGSGPTDPVEQWKWVVRACMGSHEHQACQPVIGLRVTLGFLVVAALVGSARSSIGLAPTIALLGSVMFVHELARAIVSRSLGRSCAICISARGGDTALFGAALRGPSAALFALAGSFANLFVAALSLFISKRGMSPEAASVFRIVFVSHAAWGGAHLLPVVPFRVGTVLSARLTPALRFSHTAASTVLVFAIGTLVVSRGQASALFGFVVLAMTASLAALREAYREMHDAHSGLEAACRQAQAALSEGRPELARQIAEQGLAGALSARQHEKLTKILAWAAIGNEDPMGAHAALLRLPAGAIDAHMLAAYLGCSGRIDESIELLEEARRFGHGSPESTRLLADLLFRRGDRGAVLALARGQDSILSAEDRRAIEVAVASLQSA